jgi:hypothetical protein
MSAIRRPGHASSLVRTKLGGPDSNRDLKAPKACGQPLPHPPGNRYTANNCEPIVQSGLAMHRRADTTMAACLNPPS